MPDSSSPRASVGRAIATVWIVTAVWDAICATALSMFAYHTTAARLWQGVASIVLGPVALQGGPAPATAMAGLAIHALVALTWSTIFVAALYSLPALRRALHTPGGALAIATAYGPLIWLVMSLGVIPLATGHRPRIGFRWWVQVVAHVPFVTVPLVFTARRVLLGDARRANLSPAGIPA